MMYFFSYLLRLANYGREITTTAHHANYCMPVTEPSLHER